jgi:hypothetical protein
MQFVCRWVQARSTNQKRSQFVISQSKRVEVNSSSANDRRSQFVVNQSEKESICHQPITGGTNLSSSNKRRSQFIMNQSEEESLCNQPIKGREGGQFVVSQSKTWMHYLHTWHGRGERFFLTYLAKTPANQRAVEKLCQPIRTDKRNCKDR